MNFLILTNFIYKPIVRWYHAKATYSQIPNRQENHILKNINLDIKTGMSIGIVGLSGSGKSTLISLIQRLYDVDNEKNKNNNRIFIQTN